MCTAPNSSSMDPPQGTLIRRLVGIYNAEGSVRGELTYLFAKLSGRAHCALCDITHNWIRPRREFLQAVRTIPVPFAFVHSDTRSEDLRAASRGSVPCVLAQTEADLLLLVSPEEIERCAGDPTALLDAVRRAVDERALKWPVSP